jgi:hypothetical protein
MFDIRLLKVFDMARFESEESRSEIASLMTMDRAEHPQHEMELEPGPAHLIISQISPQIHTICLVMTAQSLSPS